MRREDYGNRGVDKDFCVELVKVMKQGIDKDLRWPATPLPYFAGDYLRDPVTAAGMYECIPPLTVDAFLNPDKVDNIAIIVAILAPKSMEAKNHLNGSLLNSITSSWEKSSP